MVKIKGHIPMYEVGEEVFFVNTVMNSAQQVCANVVHRGTVIMVAVYRPEGNMVFTVKTETGAQFSLKKEQLHRCFMTAFVEATKEE